MGTPKSGNASTSGNKPTRGWDAAAHEALLLCVIDEVKGGKAFLTEVTRKMQARGYSYSYDAIKYTISLVSVLWHLLVLTHLVFLVSMFRNCARTVIRLRSLAPRTLVLEAPRLLLLESRRLLASAAPPRRRWSLMRTMTWTSSWRKPLKTKRCAAPLSALLSAPNLSLRKFSELLVFLDNVNGTLLMSLLCIGPWTMTWTICPSSRMTIKLIWELFTWMPLFWDFIYRLKPVDTLQAMG